MRKLTQEEFEEKISKINPNIIILGKYNGAHEKIRVQCAKCKTMWSPEANSLIYGHGCNVCSINSKFVTDEEFRERLKNINSNIIPMEKYRKNCEKILFKCGICNNEWRTTPNSVLSGHGCPLCGKNIGCKKSSETRTKTHEQFVLDVSSINPNILVLGKYKNARTKIALSCKVCENQWMATPDSVLRGNGCPECGKKLLSKIKSKTHEKFMIEISKVNPNITVLGKYLSAKTKIKVQCKKHMNIWDAIPSVLLKGGGCHICARERIAKKNTKSHEQFVSDLKEVNSNIVVLGTYVSSKTKIEVKCINCGQEWSAKPDNLLLGKGCPTCNLSKGEDKILQCLEEKSVDYIRQKKFPNLLGIGGGNLSYDFFIPSENLLIEFQGQQHYETVLFFGKEKFDIQQEHDRRKFEYALSHGYKLLAIPYYEINNIEQILKENLKIA